MHWTTALHEHLAQYTLTTPDLPVLPNSVSPFYALFLPEKKVLFHCIDLAIFEKESLDTFFFQEYSTQLANQNIKVIHLWEDVWLTQKEQVKTRIEVLLGTFQRLPARLCTVTRIDKPTLDDFLNKHHLQGTTNAKFKYGLFLKPQYYQRFFGENPPPDGLLAVASFSGGRTMKWGERINKRSYELYRFASLTGVVVVGGFDKLMNVFLQEHQPDDLMSYADYDWSDGRSYEKLGFTFIEKTVPNQFLLNRTSLQRRSSNQENVSTEDYLTIWNAGSLKYIKTFEKIE